jgi:hypothetical protein
LKLINILSNILTAAISAIILFFFIEATLFTNIFYESAGAIDKAQVLLTFIMAPTLILIASVFRLASMSFNLKKTMTPVLGLIMFSQAWGFHSLPIISLLFTLGALYISLKSVLSDIKTIKDASRTKSTQKA